MKEYKYTSFIELEPNPKTKRFEVRNKALKTLGIVEWFCPWHKYCFFTLCHGVVFDNKCLADIQDFINSLMQERSRK